MAVNSLSTDLHEHPLNMPEWYYAPTGVNTVVASRGGVRDFIASTLEMSGNAGLYTLRWFGLFDGLSPESVEVS